jgi:hypothetical protein
MPPGVSADPVDTLRWVRHCEIVTGLGAIASGLILWNDGWWHWLLIGVGLLSLSPWPGAAAILRRAERRPDVLIRDPERRRARARRVTRVQLVVVPLVGGVIGYLIDGWPAALTMGGLMGAGVGLGAWLVFRDAGERG